eukprot:scaffold34712_cov179-Amphora_coffeaeformis.AAC.1
MLKATTRNSFPRYFHHRYSYSYQSSTTSTSSICTSSVSRQQQQQQHRPVSTLILLRHGQSQWNGDNERFSGMCDVPLTVRGRVEAVAAGQLMRSRGFKASRVCIAFASELQRSHETCELALASMAGHEQNTWCSDRIRRDWRLNERHYGAVQGRLKEDPELRAKYGADTIRHWRRSLHGKPPPMDETHEYYQPPPMPLTESLADCQKRVLECWEDTIAPALFEEEGHPYTPDQRAVVVVAHANTIRSLMTYFDQVPEDRIPAVHVPNSVPILYRFDTETRRPLSIKLESAHGGSHARWMLSAENHAAVRKSVQSGGTLTRALFDAMGACDKDLTVSGRDLEMGVRELSKDGPAIDCVVLGVAKRISRKLQPDDVIHISEFEKLCQEGVEGLSLKHLNPNDYVSEDYGVY